MNGLTNYIFTSLRNVDKALKRQKRINRHLWVGYFLLSGIVIDEWMSLRDAHIQIFELREELYKLKENEAKGD